MKKFKEWKKVLESDLSYVVAELNQEINVPAVILLEGEVGAGKTSLVKAYNSDEEVTSPSYSVINEATNSLHADFYRVKSIDEIIHLELELYLEGKDVCFIEWGKKFLPTIKREIGLDHSYYQLDILINEKTDINPSTRNYYLNLVDKF